jgi:hypothetical protein
VTIVLLLTVAVAGPAAVVFVAAGAAAVSVGATTGALVLVGAGMGVAVDSPPQAASTGSTINSNASTAIFFENI